MLRFLKNPFEYIPFAELILQSKRGANVLLRSFFYIAIKVMKSYVWGIM